MSCETSLRGEKKFMRGVAVLAPATLLCKFIGLFYKIPLIAIVGVGGMAYFLSAYHVYSLLFVLSAAGLPTALSLLVSRHVASDKGGAVGRIFRVALAVFLLLGLAGTLGVALLSHHIAEGIAMSEATAALIAISPALALSAFTGAARGLFQGYHNMIPTAVSELIEAVSKVGFGICFALALKGRGAPVPVIAAGAVFGITVGVALSALFLLACLIVCRKRLFLEACVAPPRRLSVLKEMLRVALPVTVSASVMSLVSLVDTVLISNRLQAIGYAPAVANAVYSSYGNLAVPFYNLIPTILSPITVALTPTLSAAFAAGDKHTAREAFARALRLIALIVFPAILGLAVFARPILSMLYVGQEAAVSVAAPLLSALAPSLLPAVLIGLTGGALQAANKATVPVFSMLAGALVKLLTESVLLGLPAIHIYGAPISTLACNVTVLFINLAVLWRTVPTSLFSFSAFLRPLLAAVLAVGLGGIAYGAAVRFWWDHILLTPLFILLIAVVYVVLALAFGAVVAKDLEDIPGGGKICRVLIKCKLLREVKTNDERREITGDLS